MAPGTIYAFCYITDEGYRYSVMMAIVEPVVCQARSIVGLVGDRHRAWYVR